MSKKDVFIVYDVDEKEFVCWFEEGPVGDPRSAIDGCPFKNAHPYRDNLYFYRGQTISILLRGANLADLYTADVKVDSLEQPSIPVYGGLTELPSIQAVQPAEQLVLASGVKAAAGVTPLAAQLYTSIDTTDPKDFQNLIKQFIFDPASKPEIQQLASSTDRTLAGLSSLLASDSRLVRTAGRVCTDVVRIGIRLSTFRKTYCDVEYPPAPERDEVNKYLSDVKALNQIIERQKALKAEMSASGLAGQAKQLVSLAALLSNSSVQAALNPDFEELNNFFEVFKQEFPLPNMLEEIDGVNLKTRSTTHKNEYVDKSGASGTFLTRVNASVQSTPDQKLLVTLKKNLTYIAISYSAISNAVEELATAQKNVNNLSAYIFVPQHVQCAVSRGSTEKDSPEGEAAPETAPAPQAQGTPSTETVAPTPPAPVPPAQRPATEPGPPANTGGPAAPITLGVYQELLNEAALTTIEAANAANCTAHSMPLPYNISRPVVDQWYGNKQITVTLKKNTRLNLFDVASYAPVNLTTAGSTDNTTTTSNDTTKTKDDGTSPATSDNSPQAKTGNQKSTNKSANAPASTPTGSTDETQASTSEGAVVRQTVFRIHDVYHYELGLGFMRSDLKDQKFQLVQQSVTTKGVTTTNQFFVQSRNRSYRFLPTADLLVYPFPRDYFPWKPRFSGEKGPVWYTKLSGLMGFSLSSPTTDFFFGGAFVPDIGIGLKTGVHVGYVDTLPPGVTLGVPIKAVSTDVRQKLDHGYFVGVELQAKLFKDVFGIILKK